MPTRGVFWQVNGNLLGGLNSVSPEFSQVSSSFTYLWSTQAPSILTLAARIGGGHIFSKDFEFFQAQQLGGLTNLRGYRRTRFYGRSSFYNNLEFRLRIAQFRTYFFPVYFGLIGFNDIGRVWQDQESSQVWHHGYGGGIYLAPFNALVFSAMWGFSEEDSLPVFKLGYFF
ncbi:MAG: BamA/TamA family outer membrane protein [Cyclobacteriaceae bacterium]